MISTESDDDLHPVLTQLEVVAHASTAMLAAAYMGNWDLVIEFEDRCRLIMANLALLKGKAHHFTASEQEQYKEHVAKIRENDKSIRELAQKLVSPPAVQQIILH